MPGRVLVTGISGFIASHVALALLYAGFTVRGSLRDPARAAEVRANLERAGADTSRLEFVHLDLLEDTGWDDAMADCRYLQHIASPLVVRHVTDRDTLLRPAVEGTRRAIAAALAANVERMVLTSSVAAVTYGHPPDRTEPFTGADWSLVADGELNAYAESKTRAELEAWTLVEGAGRRHDLAVVNPAVALGPLLGPDPGVSAGLVMRLINGTMPLAPRLLLNVVDVRDLAALHVAAMTSPDAAGHRLLAAAPGPTALLDLAGSLAASFPEIANRLPRLAAPDLLVRLVALFDRDVRSFAAQLGRATRLDTAPAEALLGRPFITARLAAAATARSLLDLGLARGGRAEKRG